MLVRALVWLLAVVIMTGTAARARAAVDAGQGVPGDVGYAVDGLDGDGGGKGGLEGLEGLMPRGPEPVAVTAPEGPDPVRIEASRSLTRGRMHAVLIFRPPRLFASR